MVKATLPGAGWTLHHDAINLQIRRVAKQSEMINTMEVEEYFLRRRQESAIHPDSAMSLLGKQLRGYVPDGRQTGIASSKRPARVDQFTKIKVIHGGAVQYRRPDVTDNPRGLAADQCANFRGRSDKCTWKFAQEGSNALCDPGSKFSNIGLQALGIWNFRGGKHKCWRICIDIS